jgi:hypothetical protein
MRQDQLHDRPVWQSVALPWYPSPIGAAVQRLAPRLDAKIQELFGVDLRSLAALRIGLALLLLADLLFRAQDLVAHYTDAGVLPRAALLEHVNHRSHISLHLISGRWEVQALLFAIAACFAVLMLVGYRTRLATIASCFLLVSLDNRNPLILHSGDGLLRVLLFWAIFLPCAARWSIDSRSSRAAKSTSAQVCSLATFAYIVQVLLVYLMTALHKSGSEWRSEGTAVYYALSANEFSTHIGQSLLQFPGLLTILTFAVLLLEAVGPFLILAPIWTGPLRTLGILGFVCMQAGFGLLMANLGLFPFISMVALLGLLPSWAWDTIARRFRDTTHTQLKGPLVSRRLMILSLPSPSTERARRLPLGVPWASALLGRGAAVCASAKRAIVSRRDVLLTITVSFFLTWVIFCNLGFLPGSRYGVPQGLGWVGNLTGLMQNWAMFAPYPRKLSIWYVAPGTLRNGEQVDLYRNSAAVSLAKPESGADTYPNSHWSKYMDNLWMAGQHAGLRGYYAQYLCDSWNATHHEGEQVMDVEIISAREVTLLNGQVARPETVKLWRQRCLE